MTGEEAKEALFSEVEVVSGGIRYKDISAVIYRKSKRFHRTVTVEVEMEDWRANSVTVAPVSEVEVWRPN